MPALGVGVKLSAWGWCHQPGTCGILRRPSVSLEKLVICKVIGRSIPVCKATILGRGFHEVLAALISMQRKGQVTFLGISLLV